MILTVTLKSKVSHCYPERICGPCLKKVGYGVLTVLIGNGLGIFDLDYLDFWPCDPKLNMVAMLLRMDVWTRYEKGRSMHFLVIHRKRFWHICPRWPLTQWPPKSIGFLCYTWLMWWLSWRKVRQVVLEFSIANEKVTYGRTGRSTCAKQYARSSSKTKVCT